MKSNETLITDDLINRLAAEADPDRFLASKINLSKYVIRLETYDDCLDDYLKRRREVSSARLAVLDSEVDALLVLILKVASKKAR